MGRGTTERLAMIMDYSGWIRKETAVDFKRGHIVNMTKPGTNRHFWNI